jgi:hypothetical protein
MTKEAMTSIPRDVRPQESADRNYDTYGLRGAFETGDGNSAETVGGNACIREGAVT